MAVRKATDWGYAEGPGEGRPFRWAMAVLGTLLGVQFALLANGLMRSGALESPPARASAAQHEVAQGASLGIEPPLASEPVSPAHEENPQARAALAAAEAEIRALRPRDPEGVARSASQAGVPQQGLLAEGAGRPAVGAQEGGFFGPASPAAPATPSEAADTSLFAALATAAQGRPLEDAILERLLIAGSELRSKGNTQAALKNFREVEAALPEDPRVLSELAATLGLMGLQERALGYWERVEALGSLGAGPYYPIARRELTGEGGGAAPTASTEEKWMKIGEVKVSTPPVTEEGQKVSLAVVIDADPMMHPVADELSLIVNFYDRLPDGEIRPSTAETSYLYPTEPYDWRVDGTETIVVNYHQAALTEEEKREMPERVFHGYSIELYYRDELQDKVAMPAEIADLRVPSPAKIVEPAEPAGGVIAPQNALFPDKTLLP